jgi:hypothetical protein
MGPLPRRLHQPDFDLARACYYDSMRALESRGGTCAREFASRLRQGFGGQVPPMGLVLFRTRLALAKR